MVKREYRTAGPGSQLRLGAAQDHQVKGWDYRRVPEIGPRVPNFGFPKNQLSFRPQKPAANLAQAAPDNAPALFLQVPRKRLPHKARSPLRT